MGEPELMLTLTRTQAEKFLKALYEAVYEAEGYCEIACVAGEIEVFPVLNDERTSNSMMVTP
jgi:hypothetical protein